MFVEADTDPLYINQGKESFGSLCLQQVSGAPLQYKVGVLGQYMFNSQDMCLKWSKLMSFILGCHLFSLDTEKRAQYIEEERHMREENIRLQRKLQREMERREALCRQLSESESSLEMDDER